MPWLQNGTAKRAVPETLQTSCAWKGLDYILVNAKAAKPHGCWNQGIELCLAPEAEVRKGGRCEALTRQWTAPRLASDACQRIS